jgi:alpha-glucosidase
VREAFDEVLRFWFARGIAGFRIDVCHAIVHDRELRDDPAPTAEDHAEIRQRSLKQVYSMNRPEGHDVLRRWRALADAQAPARVLVGETYVLDLDSLIPFYGADEDELHLAFNFLFVHCELDADAMRGVVEGMEEKLPAASWPVYTGSNHDAGRLTTRWAGDHVPRARAALLMLLTLRGTPFLYYGDELALPDVPLDPQTALDPVARRTGDPADNRDVCRTPMPWADEPGGGFTTADATPWLPFGDLAACNVAAQRADPESVLNLVRDLIALRKQHGELSTGAYATLPAPAGAWAWRRGERFAVALNLSDAEVAVEGVDGRVAVATDRARDGEAIEGSVRLAPYEAVVVDLEGG